jgi:predicted permease
VRAALGRTYLPHEDAGEVAVLSHQLWARRYGSDPGIIGRVLTVNGSPMTVIGVLPPGLEIPTAQADLWVPVPISADSRNRYLRVIGRLRPGVTLERARAEMGTVAGRLGETFPDFNQGWGINLVPLHQQATGSARPALLILMGAVALLLVIACTNVASLLLSRATSRRKEMALRVSLGASRGRLIRQLLAESLVLSGLGGVLGLSLGIAGTRLLVRALPDAAMLPRVGEVRVDLPVLAFSLLVTVATGLLFGLMAALSTPATQLDAVLRDSARGSTSGREATTLRSGLVVGEIALATILLAGAGLLGRSLWQLGSTDLGFRPEQSLTVRIPVGGARYAEDGARRDFWRAATARTRDLPGVIAVGSVTHLPMTTGGFSSTGFTIVGRPQPRAEELPSAHLRWVAGDYFRAAGIPLLRGRTFAETDNQETGNVFVVNEAFVRKYLTGEDPLGTELSYTWGRIVQGRPEPFELRGTIVGVVASVRESGPGAEAAPAMYRWYRQEPPGEANLVVRTTGDPAAMLPSLASVIHSIDPKLPLADPRPMDAVVGKAVAGPRLNLLLLGVFAGIALFLAALGIYGVTSYGVVQRRHEMGVRMALGAAPGDVRGLVLRQGLRLTVIGIGLGALGAILLSGSLRTLLYGVSATDPATLAGSALFLGAIALVATYLPARRATLIDPIEALRAD